MNVKFWLDSCMVLAWFFHLQPLLWLIFEQSLSNDLVSSFSDDLAFLPLNEIPLSEFQGLCSQIVLSVTCAIDFDKHMRFVWQLMAKINEVNEVWESFRSCIGRVLVCLFVLRVFPNSAGIISRFYSLMTDGTLSSSFLVKILLVNCITDLKISEITMEQYLSGPSTGYLEPLVLSGRSGHPTTAGRLLAKSLSTCQCLDQH